MPCAAPTKQSKFTGPVPQTVSKDLLPTSVSHQYARQKSSHSTFLVSKLVMHRLKTLLCNESKKVLSSNHIIQEYADSNTNIFAESYFLICKALNI